MKANFINASGIPIPRPHNLARLAEKILRKEGLQGEINLIFCENGHIRDLNRRFRKLDKITDVLSFNYDEEEILGEIYVAAAQAKKQAPRWKNTFYSELRRLVTHGALHLAGYDHIKAKDRASMQAKEEYYLAHKL